MNENDFMNKALDRDEETICNMFSRSSKHYDVLNHLLSLNLDKGWRRALANRSKYTEYGDGICLLDLCTGTGDVVFEFLRRSDYKGQAVGLDFSTPMLELAHEKAQRYGVEDRATFDEGNALDLRYENESFNLVTIAFGLRNLNSLDKGLSEMYRVLKPGGKLLSLEFFRPTAKLSLILSGWYIKYVIPIVGRIVSGRQGAYNYLPKSRSKFLSAGEFDTKLRDAGFTGVEHKHFLFRITTLHIANKD